jgi:cytochrome c oxidase subunit 3
LTGMHAVHMIIGLGVLSTLAILATRGKFIRGDYDPIDIGGLYWHFVDIVWVFIFPLLYLVKRT